MGRIEDKVVPSPIRWAGSKKKLLNEMLQAFENNKKVYVEPFLGSGVVLLNVLENNMYNKCYVNDINSNLILFYSTLKNNVEQLVKKIDGLCREYNSLEDDKGKCEFYYKKRDSFNRNQIHAVTRSAYFWFLMKAGYNGVYRVNAKGNFNVPCGKRDKLVYDKVNLKKISMKIQNVEFFCMDYKSFMNMVLEKEKSIFVYCDPPYIPETEASRKHVLYTQNGFQHEEFMEYINETCKESDISIMISMAETENVKKIYESSLLKKVNIEEILRKVNPKKQIKSKEIAFINYNLKPTKNSVI